VHQDLLGKVECAVSSAGIRQDTLEGTSTGPRIVLHAVGPKKSYVETECRPIGLHYVHGPDLERGISRWLSGGMYMFLQVGVFIVAIETCKF
jgi:hypothetical protein